MGILKYILSPFVEFKEGEKTGPADNTRSQTVEKKKSTGLDSGETPAPAATASGETAPAGSAAGYASSGSGASPTMAEYQKYFDLLVEEANAGNPLFKGTDFKEFMDSKIDVEAIADESLRYKTTFNVLKRLGLTKDHLVNTARQYMELVDKDLKGFEGAYEQQYKADVEQKEELLRKKAEEVQALNEKITALNQEMKQMSLEISKRKDQLTSNKDLFLLAGENKKKEIQSELQKIEQYL